MRRHGERDDRGSAVVEFVFVAVVMLVPLVYLLVAVAVVQRNQVAVADAAREAGRAFATSDSPDSAGPRVMTAVRLALSGQHVPNDVDLRFVATGSGCADANTVTPTLDPGAQFTVCVSRHVGVPGVPRIPSGRGITVVGAFVVRVDEFRTSR